MLPPAETAALRLASIRANKLRAGLTGRATFEVVYGHAWMNARAGRADANQSTKTVRVFKRMP